MADNCVVLIIMIKEGSEVHKRKETAAEFYTVGVIANRTFKVIMKLS